MTVGNDLNVSWIVKSVLADLQQINTASGYRTDVRHVDLPSWPYTDKSRYYQVEAPALLVWLDSDVRGTTPENFEESRPALIFTIVGIIRQDRELQQTMLILSQDVRRIMTQNPQRNNPNNTSIANTWGVTTKEEGGVDFLVHRNDQSQAIGIFTSSWRVDYRCPRSTG